MIYFLKKKKNENCIIHSFLIFIAGMNEFDKLICAHLFVLSRSVSQLFSIERIKTNKHVALNECNFFNFKRESNAIF